MLEGVAGLTLARLNEATLAWIEIDEGAQFGSEDALRDSLVEQGSQLGHRLHKVDAVLLIGKTIIQLQEGTTRFKFQR